MANGYRKKQLQTLNECRKVLQVTTLAEISSADGVYIEPWAWLGTGNSKPLNSYQWPRPAPLERRHWLLWQQAIRKSFLQVLRTSEHKLRQPLGEWDHDIRKQWNCFHCVNDDRIYHREDAGWRVFSQHPSQVQRLRSLRFVRTNLVVKELPANVHMATTTSIPTGIKIKGTCTAPNRSPTGDYGRSPGLRSGSRQMGNSIEPHHGQWQLCSGSHSPWRRSCGERWLF